MSLTGFAFGLRQAAIAPWLAPETWGTMVTLLSCDMINEDVDTVSGILKGNDRYTDVAAYNIAGAFKLKIGFNEMSIYNILTGEALQDSSPTSQSLVYGIDDRPYFGLIGQIKQTSGGGDLQLFMPKCKIMSKVTYSGQFGQYVTPELDGICIYDTAVYGISKIIKHSTAVNPTIPPT